jgi:hypothetical protein
LSFGSSCLINTKNIVDIVKKDAAVFLLDTVAAEAEAAGFQTIFL